MSLTLPEFASVLEEVRDISAPSGLQKVYERDDYANVLQLRGRGETYYLLLDTTPGSARFHLVDRKPTQPPEPSTFTMLLRKHLTGMGLAEIERVGGDRILRLKFERHGEDASERELVAELTGRHGNLFLLQDGRVLGAQQVGHGQRELQPGSDWEPPPPPPDLKGEDRIGLGELPIGERSDAVAQYYDELLDRRRSEELRRELRAGLKREAKRLRRLRKNIEGDLERAERAQRFRKWGELLQSAYGKGVGRGTDSVTVPDYYTEGSPNVEIPLDPSRDLQENIERYFHEYRRLSGAMEQIETRLLETMERLDEVEAAREELSDAADEELEDLAARVRQADLLRSKQRQRRRRRDDERDLPYRTFRTRQGTAILVGRNAKKNDILTSRHTRGRDVWMHARDWPGSHVVLRMEKDSEPNGEDLLDAALLAAHFSKGKEDSLVDVTYTRGKHVRKPKGAAPGLVTVAGGSTIGVVPDPERLKRLLDSEERG